MENILLAVFNAAHGRVVVQEVLEYGHAPDYMGGDRIVRFISTTGERFIAKLEEIFLLNSTDLDSLKIN